MIFNKNLLFCLELPFFFEELGQPKTVLAVKFEKVLSTQDNYAVDVELSREYIDRSRDLSISLGLQSCSLLALARLLLHRGR